MPGQDGALSQLLDMGIPRGRAAAALKRAKGDAMSAAERVFAGEFDDIPSDDEQAEDDSSDVGHNAMKRKSEERIVDGVKKNIVLSDEVGDISDGDMDDIQEEFNDDESEGERLLSDPYAGVFFSKERTEEVIEPVDQEETASILVEGEKKAKQIKILGRGEWMSGCPEGNEQSYLFQLYSSLTEQMPCPKHCGHTFDRTKGDFFPILPTFSAYLSHVRSIIQQTCPKCNTIACLACGDETHHAGSSSSLHADSQMSKGKMRVKSPSPSVKNENEYEELLHCLPIQGVLIGMGLFLIEQTFGSALPAVSTSNSPAPPTKKRKTAETAPVPPPAPNPNDWDDEIDDLDAEELDSSFGGGSGKKAAAGTGYAGQSSEDRSGQTAALAAQKLADKKTSELLTQVRTYLPSLNRPSGTRSSDHLVHPTALAHLRRRSGFVNELLRNDSLLDMSERGDLYRALFDWLEVISSHEALASMLAMPQMRPTSRRFSETDPNCVVVLYEGASSPRELLESCVIQAQAALKGLQATKPKEDADEEGVEAERALQMTKSEVKRNGKDRRWGYLDGANKHLQEFCDRIISSAETIDRSLVQTKGRDFVERMQQSLPRLPDAANEVEPIAQTSSVTEETVVKIYEEWATKVRFQYCGMHSKGEDGRDVYKHAYDSEIQTLTGLDAPGRSLAIAKELAILTRNLPVAWHSTIFLRVDEARVDCIKAMIVGPEGTPYENGLFVFDIFLPIGYNQTCPHVKSMTTHGGRYRYNPNLYADGKVCLSLLGTWTGPGWISGQSTLLQVLISIQSLILCDEPYLNEPGWAGLGGSSQSKAYSANVRRMVLADAMANNIKTPPFPFENEAKTHFRLKANYIRSQLDRWKKLDDGLGVQADTHYGQSSRASSSNSGFDSAAMELRKLLDELEETK